MLTGKTKSGLEFTLRKFKKSDVSALTKNMNNKKVIVTLYGTPFPYKKKDAIEWINTNIYSRKKEYFNLVIDVNGKMIGSIGSRTIVRGHKAGFGYWLSEKYWGKGIMTEVLKVFTNYCFKEFKLIRMWAVVDDWNPGSAKVLEKNGFVREGVLRKNVKNKFGKLGDEWIYGKVK